MTVAVQILLWLGVAVELLCCAGVAIMSGAYARLHFTAPAGLGALCIAAAILLDRGFSLIADKALLTAFVVFVAAPVVSHAIARAAWLRSEPGSAEGGGRSDP